MSWSDAPDDSPEGLSSRIVALEQTINTQLSEMRTEVGLAAAAIRSGGEGLAGSAIGDLEGQLARAVTVSLSAALEAIRESLTETIAASVANLASRLETTIAAQPPSGVHTQTSELDAMTVVDEVVAQLGYRLEAAIASQPPPIVRPQWNAEKVTETVSQTVKSAVTQLGARLEAVIASQSPPEPLPLPPQLSAAEIAETVGDSVGRAVARLATRVEEAIASQPPPPPAPPAQWTASDLDDVATSLQHAVLQALNSYEQAALSSSSFETIDAPATVRDVARVNQRIDELRALLLG